MSILLNKGREPPQICSPKKKEKIKNQAQFNTMQSILELELQIKLPRSTCKDCNRKMTWSTKTKQFNNKCHRECLKFLQRVIQVFFQWRQEHRALAIWFKLYLLTTNTYAPWARKCSWETTGHQVKTRWNNWTFRTLSIRQSNTLHSWWSSKVSRITMAQWWVIRESKVKNHKHSQTWKVKGQ